MSLALSSLSASPVCGGGDVISDGKGGGKKPRTMIALADRRIVPERR